MAVPAGGCIGAGVTHRWRQEHVNAGRLDVLSPTSLEGRPVSELRLNVEEHPMARFWWVPVAFVAAVLAVVYFAVDPEAKPDPASTVGRSVAVQSALDERWPEFGDVYRNDPRLVEQLSQAVCDVVEDADTDNERGLAMLLVYETLDAQTKSFFADDLDFARFAGTVAPLRCPNAID